MNTNNPKEIYSSRIIKFTVEKVYEAFANPSYLKNWWGPHGFSNTIHEFDLRPGGKWLLTMHGPEKGNYENSSVFKIVEPMKRIAWKRHSPPLFDMEVGFKKLSATEMEISFRMLFDDQETCEKMRPFVVPKNEENFDRLEAELLQMSE